MEMMSKGELDRSKIMKRLSEFLTLEIDRKLFDFSVLEKGKAGNVTGKSKPAKS